MELKDRIATIIQVNQHTASSFADLLEVPRSRISHILNGRNKPSIDFIEKVIEHFPRVDAGWLISGKEPTTETSSKLQNEIRIGTTKSDSSPSENHNLETTGRRIEKIVIFYTDHTFETYVQSKP